MSNSVEEANVFREYIHMYTCMKTSENIVWLEYRSIDLCGKVSGKLKVG